MSKDMPWLDIFPTAIWDEFIVQYQKRSIEFGAEARNPKHKRFLFFKLGRDYQAENDMFASLRNLVDGYHSVRKDAMNTLTLRISLLEQLARKVEGYLANYKDAQRSKVNKGTVVYLLIKLARRARRKAMYLRELRLYCEQKMHGFVSATELLDYIFKDRNQQEGLVGLQPGVMLEKADPWHRAFELSLSRSASGAISATGFDQNWLSLAACRWAREPNPDDTPFFIWLEKDFVCTGVHDDRSSVYQENITQPVTSVTYNQKTASLPLIVFFSGGLAYGALHEFVPGKNQPMGPLAGPSKERGAYAYAWTRDNLLLCGSHTAGKFHHSSFTSGKKVKCAGMIGFIDGKAVTVTNDSGHYKPGSALLKAFVLHLQINGVLAVDATIKDFTKKQGLKSFTAYSVDGFMNS
ncbi:MAG: hypothetical protein AB1916_15495 [Thermodesulfobacteriota bacterium]